MLTKRRVSIMTIVACAIYYFTVFRSRKLKPASEALQDIFDYSDLMHSVETKLQILLSENKYSLLVVTHLKPAVDEIASIRKQVEIYENMRRIPGGPQNFMETSQAKLDKIRMNLLSWEKEYRIAMYRLNKDFTAIGNEIDRCDSNLQLLDIAQDSLALLLIYISTLPEDMEKPQGKLEPLDRTILIMRNKLFPLVKEFETIKIENSETPFFEQNDVYNMELIKLLIGMKDVIEMYGAHFERVGMLLLEKLEQIKKLTHEILKIDIPKQRYEDIANGIDQDITVLTEKINNLKYPKKNVEL